MVQIRKVRKVMVAILCSALFLATVPKASFAGDYKMPDYEAARNPAALIAKMKAENLPDMSKEDAKRQGTTLTFGPMTPIDKATLGAVGVTLGCAAVTGGFGSPVCGALALGMGAGIVGASNVHKTPKKTPPPGIIKLGASPSTSVPAKVAPKNIPTGIPPEKMIVVKAMPAPTRVTVQAPPARQVVPARKR
jgi:hypothetical protein